MIKPVETTYYLSTITNIFYRFNDNGTVEYLSFFGEWKPSAIRIVKDMDGFVQVNKILIDQIEHAFVQSHKYTNYLTNK